MTSKLTATQANILKAAAERGDGNIEPLPTTLRGGAKTTVIQGLLNRGWVSRQGDAHWMTDAGYAALGIVPSQSADTEIGKAVKPVRQSSKQAVVIQMLRRPEGATVTQIMEVTGWQAHSLRGFFAGTIKKKLGLSLVSEKSEDGVRTYKIEETTAGSKS